MNSPLKLTVLITLIIFLYAFQAAGAELKIIGIITKLELAPDGKSAIAVLKDNNGKEVTITVVDELTLDKFKDHRIVEGDEIRCKYEVIEGKNISRYFRKTAGC